METDWLENMLFFRSLFSPYILASYKPGLNRLRKKSP
jgi:hypothetical protein